MRAVGKSLWFIALTFWIFMHLGGALRAEPVAVDSIVITGLDVSSSINAVETQLQIDGVAAALRSPAVLRAVQAGRRGRSAFLVFLWADGSYPVVLSWRVIGSQADADAAAAEITATMKAMPPAVAVSTGTLTNLSGALENAAALLSGAPFRAERRLVNIVSNGEDNVGEGPTEARARLLAIGATINAVVVGGDPSVISYYRNIVIGGLSAFARPASKPEDLVGALISKFVSEIASVQ